MEKSSKKIFLLIFSR